MILQGISLVIFFAYALLIFGITIGWWRLKVFKSPASPVNVKISVIVAARNEAGNIESLLKSLLQQNYPPGLLEIIIIDDHSTDDTALIAEGIIVKKNQEFNLKLIKLNEKSGLGKKAAIHGGINASSGELIVITDADCTFGTSWISTIAAYYEMYRPQMILGPVRMTDGGSLFGKLQSLEFMSLISTAAGSCNAGFPLLANGANIAFTRKAYDSCNGFSGNMHFPSGDDMFLMMNIKKKFGANAIRFLRSEDAIVSTPAMMHLNPFIQQRLRWVSKSRGYRDPFLIAASMIVFLSNFCLVSLAFSALFFSGFIKFFLLLFLIKTAIDFPLMFSFNRFQRSGFLLMVLFPFMELLNAVYTVFIGITGNFAKYEWKGRTVSSGDYKKRI
jgi:cellulose synthase/poly-beta-1,6-N-acetylglucosamine synthase-like glycosyltransferase